MQFHVILTFRLRFRDFPRADVLHARPIKSRGRDGQRHACSNTRITKWIKSPSIGAIDYRGRQRVSFRVG